MGSKKTAEEKAVEALDEARRKRAESDREHAAKVREAEDNVSKVRGEPQVKRWPPDDMETK